MEHSVFVKNEHQQGAFTKFHNNCNSHYRWDADVVDRDIFRRYILEDVIPAQQCHASSNIKTWTPLLSLTSPCLYH